VAGSVEQFERLLADEGLADRVVRLQENTRTAELAAQALGTEVGAIVKSLVVLVDGQPCLALVSGDRRADLGRVARLFRGDRAEMARGARVKEITGFAIGGVPPLLSDEEGRRLPAVIDRSLFRYAEVWAAAGSPYAVFPIAPSELARLASAPLEDFVEP
jgi:prolyl-tRNA editing enzyme YbaK/EbsC (Cys-tRNA(Pro) deacylase)